MSVKMPSEPLIRVARQAKIVGGTEANLGEFPHQVALSYNDEFLCGGSIISTLLILTAAHCLKYKRPNRLKVIAGLHDQTRLTEDGATQFHLSGGDEQIRTAKFIYIHENYVWETDINDIAIIVLNAPFQYTTHVKNISLPRENEDFEGYATVSGWGKTQEKGMTSEKLLKVRIPIVPMETCRKRYQKLRYKITDNMFCVGETGRDSCQGDSGGAAICSRSNDSTLVQCGVVSFGHGCGRTGFPGIYTRVANYIDWIENTEQKIIARGKCRTDHYFCSSGPGCIPRTFLCDLESDCKEDGEDERGCIYMTSCRRGQFRCNNGRCIKSEYTCDDMDDCGDRSDEDKCPTENKLCVGGQHQCGVGGRCIPEEWKCDGWEDCDDNSDEENCASKDSKNEIVPVEKPLSNGTTTTEAPCSADQFHCSRDFRCIPIRWRCDGDRDCRSGMDELACDDYLGRDHVSSNSSNTVELVTNPTTTRRPVTTRSTTSRPTITISDTGSLNPTTSSPAISTTTTARPNPCTAEEFSCSTDYKLCIPRDFRCDGDLDCPSGVDELKCDDNHDRSPINNANTTGAVMTTTTKSPNVVISTTTATTTTTPRLSTTAHHSDKISPRPGAGKPTPSRPTMTTTTSCTSEEFTCSTDFNHLCIPLEFRCDGDLDCPSGADELECDDNNIDSLPISTTEGVMSQTTRSPSTTRFTTVTTTTVRPSSSSTVQPTTTSNPMLGNPTTKSPQTKTTTIRPMVVSDQTTSKSPKTTTKPSLDSPSILSPVLNQTATTTPCSAEQFYCSKDFRCIPIDWRCDGHEDCRSGMDERGCSTTTTPKPATTTMPNAASPCAQGQFYCPKDFRCIPLDWRCDGHDDCRSGVDERGCSTTTTPKSIKITTTTTASPCTAKQFFCSKDFRCIPKDWKCDGHADCRSGMDELECGDDHDIDNLIINAPNTTEQDNNPTTRSPFTTRSTTTTTTTKAPPPTKATTKPSLIDSSSLLPSSSSSSSIPTNFSCTRDQFHCGDGQCISNVFQCDYDTDCDNGKDEEDCDMMERTCTPYFWRCGNGQCIYHRFLCDKEFDCVDGTDELNCELNDDSVETHADGGSDPESESVNSNHVRRGSNRKNRRKGRRKSRT